MAISSTAHRSALVPSLNCGRNFAVARPYMNGMTPVIPACSCNRLTVALTAVSITRRPNFFNSKKRKPHHPHTPPPHPPCFPRPPPLPPPPPPPPPPRP